MLNISGPMPSHGKWCNVGARERHTKPHANLRQDMRLLRAKINQLRFGKNFIANI